MSKLLYKKPPVSISLPSLGSIKDQSTAEALKKMLGTLNGLSQYVAGRTTPAEWSDPQGPRNVQYATTGGTINVQWQADTSGPLIKVYRVYRLVSGLRLSPVSPGPDAAVCIAVVPAHNAPDAGNYRYADRDFTIAELDPSNPTRYSYWITSVDDRDLESAFVKAAIASLNKLSTDGTGTVTEGPIELVPTGSGDDTSVASFIPLNKLHDPAFENTGVTTANVAVPARVSISSSTNASPIEITTATNHGLTVGDLVAVSGHQTNTAANGWWIVQGTPSVTRFTLTGSTGNGVGANTGSVYPSAGRPAPPDLGRKSMFPFTTGDAVAVYLPWFVLSGDFGDVEFVSNGTIRTNELRIKENSTALTSLGARLFNFGMRITLSLHLRRSGSPTDSQARIQMINNAGNVFVFNVDLATVPTTYRRYTFTCALDVTAGTLGPTFDINIINLKNSGTGADLYVKRAMLNVGDKAAAWTPALDAGSYLNAAEDGSGFSGVGSLDRVIDDVIMRDASAPYA